MIAPADENTILDDKLPVVVFFTLIYIIVLETVVPLLLSVTLPVKPDSLVVLTSKPLGGVIRILLVRSTPETVKLCSSEVFPKQ